MAVNTVQVTTGVIPGVAMNTIMIIRLLSILYRMSVLKMMLTVLSNNNFLDQKVQALAQQLSAVQEQHGTLIQTMQALQQLTVQQ